MVPARPLFVLLLAWALLGVAAAALPALIAWWSGAGVALALLAAGDALLARRTPHLRIERELAGVLPVGVWRDVGVRVHHAGARTCDVELFDAIPSGWECAGLPWRVQVEAGGWTEVRYQVRAGERGDAAFGVPWLRVRSRFGLWRALHRIGPTQTVRMFPDYSAVLRQHLNGTDRRLPSAGALLRRQRGEGTDFAQLREYRRGDSLRSIDWKATARHRRPISREYRLERDQQVMFLLDCSRRMLARDGLTSHFDHALHAILTLSYVASRQGDAVGVLSFGAEARWLPPAKGARGLDRVLAGLYDLQPAEAAPDYLQAAEDLMGRLGKRALVVLVTNLGDEDAGSLQAACSMLGRRHLVLCASLRERALDEAAAQPVRRFPEALRAASAELYLQQRREAIMRGGLPRERLLDVTPAELGVGLLNRYLDIKLGGRL
ncbi:MAG: DUF58 domain-containing protein [Telluria sp.]